MTMKASARARTFSTRTPEQVQEAVERIARIIDPEAFGLPNNIEDGTLTDRDEARDRARIILTAVSESDGIREFKWLAGEKVVDWKKYQIAEREDGFWLHGPVVNFGPFATKEEARLALREVGSDD